MEETLKIINYKEIGSVVFIRKNKVRNLRIIIKPYKDVNVVFPKNMSIESAVSFVEQKKDWIKKSQSKIKVYENKITVFDEHTIFKTNDYTLKIGKHEKSTIKTIIGNGLISIKFPDYANINDNRIQKAIRNAINKAWKIEAMKYLPERLNQLSSQHNLKYNALIMRDNKSRWGSCSRNNKISLNIHLMRLPMCLCDYVILHELAHTIHKNHQKRFWDFLQTLTNGRAKELDKELNNYNPQIW
jgi:predicted metal-dependent hydrolase